MPIANDPRKCIRTTGNEGNEGLARRAAATRMPATSLSPLGFDHMVGRRGARLRFKDLFFGYVGRPRFVPVDFDLHGKKPLSEKQRKALVSQEM